MLFIGLDSGTQSTKAVVLDLDSGEIIASAQQGYDLISGLPDGHLEQHPRDWVYAVDTTIAQVVEAVGARKSEIKGIGVSGQQHGLVVLDSSDAVIRPAKLWCDTSTTAQCAQLEEAFGGASGLIAKAGNAIPAGFTAPKILWLKQEEPENFAKVASVLLPHDYLNFHLTGVKRMEFGDASGTGLLDVRTRTWCSEIIDFIDPSLAGALPEVGSSLDVHGTLRPELAQKWGLGEGVIVSAGGGDNMMGAIGTGNIRPGVVTASLGTSGTLYGAAGDPIIDPQGEVAAFCDSADHWMPLVCTMNVTVLTEQMRGLFGWDHAQLEAHVKDSKPGAEGLVFLPYLNGERTPNLPDGKGVLYGATATNLTQANIARASVEGVTLGLAYGLRRFRDLGLGVDEIRITGGGSKSAAWRQVAADAFGVPVVGLQTAEGAGLGGAVQAAYAALRANNEERSYEDLCKVCVKTDESTRATPDSAVTAQYSDQLDQQLDLTKKLFS